MTRLRENPNAWCWRGLLVCCVLIAIVAVVPYGRDARTVMVFSLGLDKIVHFLGFAFMAVLAIGAGKGLPLWKRASLVLLVLVFGAAVEWFQYYLPYRTFNPLDIVANTFGVLSGVAAGIMALQTGRRRAQSA